MTQDTPEATTPDNRAEDDTKAQQREQRSVPLELKGSMECPKFYANVATVLSTPFDVQIIFGEVAEITEEKVMARAEARIIMAPEHAALLLKALTLRVDSYTQQHGKLRGIPVTVGPSVPVRGGLNEG